MFLRASAACETVQLLPLIPTGGNTENLNLLAVIKLKYHSVKENKNKTWNVEFRSSLM